MFCPKKGDLVFLAMASEPTVEHIVKVKAFSENVITSDSMVTVMKIPTRGNTISMHLVPGFGLYSNSPIMEGGELSDTYINCGNFDVYGAVIDPKMIDMFNNFVSGVVDTSSEVVDPTGPNLVSGIFGA